MHNEIYWVLTLSVKPGQFDEFKKLVTEIVAETTKEPGALAYEYSVNADQTVVHVFERYTDSAAVVKHVDETFVPRAERFVSLASPTGLVVYGTPNEEARKRLAGLGADYMNVFAGFKRWD
jgi:quinol monooxygenase YgiN